MAVDRIVHSYLIELDGSGDPSRLIVEATYSMANPDNSEMILNSRETFIKSVEELDSDVVLAIKTLTSGSVLPILDADRPLVKIRS